MCGIHIDSQGRRWSGHEPDLRWGVAAHHLELTPAKWRAGVSLRLSTSLHVSLDIGLLNEVGNWAVFALLDTTDTSISAEFLKARLTNTALQHWGYLPALST